MQNQRMKNAFVDTGGKYLPPRGGGVTSPPESPRRIPLPRTPRPRLDLPGIAADRMAVALIRQLKRSAPGLMELADLDPSQTRQRYADFEEWLEMNAPYMSGRQMANMMRGMWGDSYGIKPGTPTSYQQHGYVGWQRCFSCTPRPVTHWLWATTPSVCAGAPQCLTGQIVPAAVPAGTPAPNSTYNRLWDLWQFFQAGFPRYNVVARHDRLTAGSPAPKAYASTAVGAPYPAPSVYSEVLYEVGPKVQIQLKPYVQQSTDVIVDAGGAIKVPGGHVRVPPLGTEREGKFVVRTGIAGQAMGAVTEASDFVQCLANNVEKKTRSGRTYNPCANIGRLQDRAACVVRNAAHINMEKAVECMAFNEIQDFTIGKINKTANDAVVRDPRYKRPVGIGFGGSNMRNVSRP